MSEGDLSLMEAYETINKSREYLDYIEEHIKNVQKAFIQILAACRDMEFMKEDALVNEIIAEVYAHDVSKLSEHEFAQYRKVFYPTAKEKTEGWKLGVAWDHHKDNNPHHWETWTARYARTEMEWVIHCVHMVVDWTAMGYKFGDTAQEYYEKNKDKIDIPDFAVKFLHKIFDALKKWGGCEKERREAGKADG